MLKVKKTINTILWLSIVLCFGLDCLMWFTFNKRHYTYSYDGTYIIKHSWHEVLRIFIWISIAFTLISAIAFAVLKIIQVIKDKKDIISNILLVLFVGLIAVFVSFQADLVLWLRYNGGENSHCYEFSNGEKTIVIEEELLSLHGPMCGIVYQVNNDMTAEKIGFIGRADRGENEDEYEVKWYDDYVEITYDPCQPDNQLKTKTIKLK